MEEKKKILVVDDEAPILKLSSTILRSAGYEVDQAGGGREGVAKYMQLASSVPPALVLSDIQMPEMNGIDLVEAIRAVQPDQPIILCSARQIYELNEMGLVIPEGIPLVNKPFAVADLIKLIGNMLA